VWPAFVWIAVPHRPFRIALLALPVCVPACLLAGCMAAPAAPPSTTLAMPDRLADQTPDGAAPPPSAWWQLYGDPALDRVVAEALANNRDLRAAAAHLQAARAVEGTARARRLPSTTVSAGAGGGSTLQDQITAAWAGSDTIRTGPRYDLGGDVAWDMDLFGRLKAGARAAHADAQASAALLDEARVAVAADVTGAWLRACSYAHQAAIARDRLAQARQGRDLAQRLMLAGAGVPVDVLRAEAQADGIEAMIPALEAARRDALTQMAVLSGHVPGDGPVQAAACAQVPGLAAPPLPGDGYALLRRRPDIRAAESRLAAATARIGVVVADFYPRITLSGQQAVSAPTPAGLGARANMVWRVGPLLDWSFPNIAAARARVGPAPAGAAEALASYDAAILQALAQVNEAARDHGAALERQAALARAARHSALVAASARQARMAGAASALDLLAAQRAQSDAAAALAAADGDVAAAQVRLFRALGGGWEQAPPVALPDLSRNRAAAPAATAK
jgi:NodT family efflux transporter outer membrane factor (OMF) lipoprotein